MTQQLPVLKHGLCPDCLEKVRIQEERYFQRIPGRPFQGENQHSDRYPWLDREFTGAEWAILNALKRADGRPMTQARLAYAVYGVSPWYDNRHAIRQRIYKLREKLEGTPYEIVRLGQAGYKLVARGLHSVLEERKVEHGSVSAS